MHFKQIDDVRKTFELVFDTGDELASGLQRFAEEQQPAAYVRPTCELVLTESPVQPHKVDTRNRDSR